MFTRKKKKVWKRKKRKKSLERQKFEKKSLKKQKKVKNDDSKDLGATSVERIEGRQIWEKKE